MTETIEPPVGSEDELRALDSLLIRRAAGTLKGDSGELHQRARQLHASPEYLNARQADLVARKGAEAAARAPKFNGKPWTRIPSKEKAKFVIGYFPAPNVADIGQFLRDDRPRPVPNLYESDVYIAPNEDWEQRDYLTSLLVLIADGKLKPGCAATISEKQAREIPGVAHFTLDKLPLSLRIEKYTCFVRLPDQSDYELEALVAKLRAESKRLDNL